MKFYIFVWIFFSIIFLATIFHLPVVPTLSTHQYDSDLFNNLGEIKQITGIVVAEPDQRETYTGLIILPQEKKEEKEKILARVYAQSNFQYGDEVKVLGKLELPEIIESESGNNFNYPEYLAKDGIYYLINKAEAEIISRDHGNSVKRYLFKIKQAFLSNIDKSLPEPHSGFAGGVIIAGKKALPKTLLEQFQKTGTLQIVVLSGYNIAIVAEAITKIFSFLPRAGGFIAGAASIILFSLMAGGSGTIVRAAVMALIAILAKATHRVYDAKRALFMAGFLMVLQNPRILVYDPSFQLSFLATLGLIVLSPFFEKYLFWVPEKFQFRSIISATISAQIFVTPLILYQIGKISLVSIPSNVLMISFIPIIMLFGFITGLAGFISSIIAWPVAFISYLLLSYELAILKIFSSLPYALVSISFPIWMLFISYGIYVLIYLVRSKRSETAFQFKLSKKASTYFFFSDGG